MEKKITDSLAELRNSLDTLPEDSSEAIFLCLHDTPLDLPEPPPLGLREESEMARLLDQRAEDLGREIERLKREIFEGGFEEAEGVIKRELVPFEDEHGALDADEIQRRIFHARFELQRLQGIHDFQEE